MLQKKGGVAYGLQSLFRFTLPVVPTQKHGRSTVKYFSLERDSAQGKKFEMHWFRRNIKPLLRYSSLPS